MASAIGSIWRTSTERSEKSLATAIPDAAGPRLLVAVPQQGEVFPGTGTQVTEDLAVAGLAAERGVGKIRAQFDQLAPGRVLARDGHALRRELLVVIAVEDVGDLDAAVQVIERAAAGLGDDMRRKFRDRVAAVDCAAGPGRHGADPS